MTNLIMNLSGTEKQTTWAEDVIAKMEREADDLANEVELTPEQQAQVRETARKAIQMVVERHPDATYWIDHRHDTIQELLAETWKEAAEGVSA